LVEHADDPGAPVFQAAPPAVACLALAGVNGGTSAAGGFEDGVLTGEEVLSLDLSGVEWVVLSACESGVADGRAVESVQGLHRAFRIAGVPAVVVSLWGVEDEAACEWMEALYQARLQRGRSTSEAASDASRTILAARRARGDSTHPFYWGALVATGDPR
jgi:CHAT domain-containing protein